MPLKRGREKNFESASQRALNSTDSCSMLGGLGGRAEGAGKIDVLELPAAAELIARAPAKMLGVPRRSLASPDGPILLQTTTQHRRRGSQQSSLRCPSPLDPTRKHMRYRRRGTTVALPDAQRQLASGVHEHHGRTTPTDSDHRTWCCS